MSLPRSVALILAALAAVPAAAQAVVRDEVPAPHATLSSAGLRADRECPCASPARPSIQVAALTVGDLALHMPLTRAEAQRALERELSVKVGKQMSPSDYPAEARRWGWSGTALVEVLVSEEGYVRDVNLTRSSGYSLLDEQALTVVRRVPRLFVPVQLRGRPQRATVPIVFHFPRL
jgi:TonB family protein